MGLGTRVRAHFGPENGWYRGTVVKHDISAVVQPRVRIHFDDGEKLWVGLNDPNDPWFVHPLTSSDDTDGNDGLQVVAAEYDELELKCEISGGRLVDPACGDQCRHVASINRTELSRYVSKPRRPEVQNALTCPHAFCGQPLTACRQIVRDDWLANELKKLPQEVIRVRIRKRPRELLLIPCCSSTAMRADGAPASAVIALDDDDDEKPTAKKPKVQQPGTGARGAASSTGPAFTTPPLDDGKTAETGIELSDDEDDED